MRTALALFGALAAYAMVVVTDAQSVELLGTATVASYSNPRPMGLDLANNVAYTASNTVRLYEWH